MTEPTVYAISGKGGTGKTTSATTFALECALQGHKVGVIDCDRGYSVGATFGLSDESIHPNRFNETPINGLYASRLETYCFDPIPVMPSGEGRPKGETEAFLNQFKNDYGVLAMYDMIFAFFGVCTDVRTASDIVTLRVLYDEAKEKKLDTLVLDLEPTAGAGRFIGSIDRMYRSLLNLYGNSQSKTAKLLIGAAWKDIRKFMEGSYTKNIPEYAKRLREIVDVLERAEYVLTCVPKSNPVNQMLTITEPMVRGFGGLVRAYIINDVGGSVYKKEEKMEIVKVNAAARGDGLDEQLRTIRGNIPVIGVKTDRRLAYNVSEDERMAALRLVGKQLYATLGCLPELSESRKGELRNAARERADIFTAAIQNAKEVAESGFRNGLGRVIDPHTVEALEDLYEDGDIEDIPDSTLTAILGMR